MPTIQDRIRQRAQQGFVGRTQELSRLWQALDKTGAWVTFVSGIGGIGKSTLLNAFVRQLQDQQIPVLPLDCRAIEPSEQGVLLALGQLCEHPCNTVGELRPVLAAMGQPVVITFDTYELFRLLDDWLRHGFVPALPDCVRLFFFGREAPVTGWFTAPGWQEVCQHLRLGALDEAATMALLQQTTVPSSQMGAVSRFAQGHPLALRLAAAALAERPDLSLPDLRGTSVIGELAQVYLQDARDLRTRQVLEAASVVRRTTRSLLAVMMPDVPDPEAYEHLLQLPFVEIGPEGLVLHDLVRQSISRFLQATDPEKYHTYRRRAWQHLRQEWASASSHYRWRYTADMLYLIEHPMVHDAFFPPNAHVIAMEPARAEDGEEILAIARNHENAPTAEQLKAWWQQVPTAFRVARDAHNQLVGFSQIFDPVQVPVDLLLADPITRSWWQELQANPVPPGQRVFFIRRALGKYTGEALSQIQAACWLDAKRLYLEHRDTLRRVYIVFRSVDEQGPIVERLGFRPLDQGISLDDEVYYSYQLDFGAQQVMGWLAGLVDAQYGTPDTKATAADAQPSCHQIFDIEGHALVMNGDRTPLTPLEYGVLHYLYTHPGKAVSRITLLEEVWGYDYEGGSNVVDSIVRSLRKKLKSHASAITTVTGVGYRFDGFKS